MLSVSIAEDELRVLPIDDMVGHYSAWSYFQSVDRKENREFVARFKAKYGNDRVTSDVIEAAYFSVLLWEQAARESGKVGWPIFARRSLGQSLNAPEGVVSIDPETQHTWRSFYARQESAATARSRSSGLRRRPSGRCRTPYPGPIPIGKGFCRTCSPRWNGTWANPVPPKPARRPA